MRNITPDLKDEKEHITAKIDEIQDKQENRLRGLTKLEQG